MSTVVAVDLAAIYWRHWHATGSDTAPDAAARSTVSQVRDLARRHDLHAVCLDSPLSWRRDAFAGDDDASDLARAVCASYKAAREEKPAHAIDQLRRVVERLRDDGLCLLGADGYEADDVAAGVVEWARSRGHECIIATADKDLGQLVAPDVTWLRTDNGATLDEAGVTARYGVTPAQLGDYLALVGDASDNIPGVPGVGPKTAAKLLGVYGSIGGIVAALRTGDERLRGKLADALRAHEEQVGVARLLVSLRPPAIDYSTIEQKREPVPLADKLEQNMTEHTEAEYEPIAEPTPAPQPAPKPAPASEPTRQRPEQKADAIVVAAEPGTAQWNLALEPQSGAHAMRVASILAASGGADRFARPEAIYGAILYGRSLGLSVMASIQNVHLVKGKFCLGAHAIIGRVLQARELCEQLYCEKSDAQSATWLTKRKGQPERRLTYTLDEANAAGLTKGDSGWSKYPARMLEKTAGVMLARLVYPDITAGLYAPEELGGAS